jgi:hypothetical protein
MELTANFIVISKRTRTMRSFDMQEQVDKFMVGRIRSHWAIYKLQTETADVSCGNENRDNLNDFDAK